MINEKQIGILGGTFNPIHIGHLILAEWVLDALALDEVWFMPTGCPYLKDSAEVLPGRERLRMTELAVADHPLFRSSDLEVKREGHTYSYETLEQLKQLYPRNRFFFIVGADCLFSIENWKNPQRIFDACILAAAVRDEISPAEMEKKKYELEQKFKAEIMLVPFVSMSVSSTEIRRRIAGGFSVKYLVPDKVLNYINEKGFYREKNE
ncbi:nicotinate-nucleotide adenylyltransferase [Acetatifactor muris]|uniref:nicotinate-nucleotide adenylyltransferase n=1 Tax=Acetatifactor muris TaxID=879566 RepID=UPI0023F17B58|nr:nicotinate-nucleotide adenylyltransferase [Acetatifactor muris]